jgi:hypothetical protein
MKNWQLLTAVVAVCALFNGSNAQAGEIPTLLISIDGESPTEPIPVHEVDGVFRIGLPPTDPEEEPSFTWGNGEGSINMSGELDPDPSIIFGASATDFGAPSNFSFTYILPLSPQVSNPSRVFDSFSGSVTNSLVDGSASVTPRPHPVPVDGDGIDEVQVFTLSDDNGVTWQNVGLDLGPFANFPVGQGGSGIYGPYAEGFIPTIAGGKWTHMRADIQFRLSGGADTFTFNGIKTLIPEPSSLVLLLVSLGALSFRRGRFV